MTVTEIVDLIRSVTYHFQHERELQRGIAQVLTTAGLEWHGEVCLGGPKNRIDFFVGDIGIETKVDGGLADTTRQLWRYAESPQIGHLILVTTRQRHLNMPDKINGKPLYVIHLLNL